MSKFADELKVMFFLENKIIEKNTTYEYSKLEDDSSLHLNLNSSKDTNLLHLLLNSDKIILQNKSYPVVSREFMTDGTALYIELRQCEGCD